MVRALQVRFRFIAILAAASIVAGQWDTLRNYLDHWTRGWGKGSVASRAVPPNIEYFCPMDPAIVSMQPGRCGICNMGLVRRKIGDMAPLPSGVLARMQISPYRVQLAGIRTAPTEYRALEREVGLTGVVRDDDLIHCRVPEHVRSLVVVGQATTCAIDDSFRQPGVRGTVIALNVDSADLGGTVVIRLAAPPSAFKPGTRVKVTLPQVVADMEPFRSLPTGSPPLVKGDLLAVYLCPRHPEVLAIDRGRCPVDRDDELQRQPLLDNQRIRWGCPMHPTVTADCAGASCDACGGMKLVPQIITFQPPGQVLTVPESAVVDTGMRAVVFVERMAGLFDAVEVVVGPRCGDFYPVARGLGPGERVAISGAFLLDAETRLNPGLAANYFGAGRTTRTAPTGTLTDPSSVPEQDACPVTGRTLGSMGPPVTVTVNGRTVRLCCQGCEARLRDSPEKYLAGPKAR